MSLPKICFIAEPRQRDRNTEVEFGTNKNNFSLWTHLRRKGSVDICFPHSDSHWTDSYYSVSLCFRTEEGDWELKESVSFICRYHFTVVLFAAAASAKDTMHSICLT